MAAQMKAKEDSGSHVVTLSFSCPCLRASAWCSSASLGSALAVGRVNIQEEEDEEVSYHQAHDDYPETDLVTDSFPH